MFLREAGFAIPSAANPDANTNNPTRRWAIAEAAGRLTREFGTPRWSGAVDAFIAEHGTLAERMNRYRDLKRPGVVITLSGGRPLRLAPGPHNDLQRQVVEGFLPRFAPDSEVLYVGDTSKKILHRDVQQLSALGFFDLEHGRLPDIVAFDSVRHWILLIDGDRPRDRYAHERRTRAVIGSSWALVIRPMNPPTNMARPIILALSGRGRVKRLRP